MPSARAPQILFADDDGVTRRIVQGALEEIGYEVVVASDGEEALRVLLAPGGPRLAVLDRKMPGLDGLEVCRRVREEKRDRYTYLLVLTASDRKEDIVEGLESGADDYLTKPFDVRELEARLAVGRRILDLEGELVAAREELRIQATRDSLTGLWNWAAIVDLLRRELDRARRARQPVALLAVDVDHFKAINDTFGHLTGDRVLAEVAARIRGALRPYDTIGRYGGEEFLVILPGVAEEEAEGLGERLRRAVGGTPIAVASTEVAVTVSVGAAVEPKPRAEGWEGLLARADAALYRAKAAGRDRVERAAVEVAAGEGRAGRVGPAPSAERR